jgi:NAD(P) transhydrogenase subunit alpha
MIVGVPKETFPGERRVALVPAGAAGLVKAGLEVLVEAAAGQAAGYPDAEYQGKGARIAGSRDELFAAADVIVQVRALGANPEAGRDDLERFHRDQVLIGLCEPLSAPQAIQEAAQRGVAAFAMELMPRITRAQTMDALSSQASIAGYKAVLLGASALGRMFPMMMTAAGTITAAKVFVIGAGVAGLQAIATAHRLGAVVKAYDVRPAVKEQVESVGAKFVELPLESAEAQDAGGYAKALGEEFYRRQRELMARVVAESDVVITTAAVPGKKAPLLVTAEMVRGMRPGSVIVDLAAERGGNCELTRAGQTIVERDVTILGPVNLAATVPHDASQTYSRNITSFLHVLIKDGLLHIDLEDEIVRETLMTRGGEVLSPPLREVLGLPLETAATGKE